MTLETLKKIYRSKNINKVYKVNKMEIKANWHELLYDLIFIIFIEKIITIYITSSHTADIKFVFEILLISMMILWVWNERVLQTNHMYILENELNVHIPQYKFLIYIEMTILLLLLHKLGTYPYIYFFVSIFLISVVFEFICMEWIRHKLFSRYKRESKEMYDAAKSFWEIRTNSINIEHILERFGVLTILFLGETMREVFLSDTHQLVLILFCIILFNIFESSTKLSDSLKEQSIKESTVKYNVLTRYLRRSLILLLFLILAVAYTHKYHVEYPVILITVILLNKFHQEYALFKLGKISLNKYEIMYYIYLFFITLYVLLIKNYNIFTLILISVLAILTIFKDSYHTIDIGIDFKE
ncbi:MAG: hypothetical protein ACK5LV_06570 [Lachnospirales bacterium]